MLKKSKALREMAEKNMNNPDEPMTVDFADFVELYGHNPSGELNQRFGTAKLVPSIAQIEIC